MLIQTTDKFSDGYGIKCIVYGESGSGKTRLSASLLTAGYKPLLISAESGTRSLAGFKVPMIDLAHDDKGNPVELHDRVKRLYEVFTFLKEGKHDFDTIILDSLTEINDCLMAYLKKKYPDPKQNLPKYGENSDLMTKIVKDFRDLKYNVVLVTLSTIDKDDSGRRFINIDLVGKVAAKIPALFDEVLYLYVSRDEKDGMVRKILCQPTESIKAKDRSGKLEAIEEADLGFIFNKIKEK